MLRNFLWFPIISITLFNITFKIQDKNYQVPELHYIILASLIALYLCSFFLKKRS
jgi:hypothetical protein